MAKVGKHVPSLGHQLVDGNVTFTAAGTSTVIQNGQTGGGATNTWLDIYSIDITSTDTTPQTVTISDGTKTLEYEVASPAAVSSNPTVPSRFKQGADLKVTLGAITSGKRISVVVRGVLTST